LPPGACWAADLNHTSYEQWWYGLGRAHCNNCHRTFAAADLSTDTGSWESLPTIAGWQHHLVINHQDASHVSAGHRGSHL